MSNPTATAATGRGAAEGDDFVDPGIPRPDEESDDEDDDDESGEDIAAAHVLEVAASMTGADMTGLMNALDIIVQDQNGDDVYDNTRAAVGYLAEPLFMLIPDHIHAKITSDAAYHVDLIKLGKRVGISDYFGNSTAVNEHRAANPYLAFSTGAGAWSETERKMASLELMTLNYAAMRLAGLDSPNAWMIAALRARWVITGAYHIAKFDTDAAYNEVRVVDILDPVYGRILRAGTAVGMVNALGKYARDFAAEYKDAEHGIKWVTKHAENIWAAVEHAFRVRSHHMKTQAHEIASWTDLYNRYMEAAYEGNFAWPAKVDLVNIVRTAIHPFKVKSLPMMVANYTAHKKIANAAINRLSGSPSGHAVITTTAAAIDTMRGEAWWSAFYKVYKDMVDATISFAAQINDNRYAYHQFAGLYGLEKKKTLTYKGAEYSMDKAKSYTGTIAAACQGLINALADAVAKNIISKFALANARALEKPASANPLLALRITALVAAAIDAVSDATSVKAAIESALPNLEQNVSSSESSAVVEVD